MSDILYSKYPILSKLFWYFQHYYNDANVTTMGNLFLLVISMLALKSFRSVRYAWIHIVSKLTGKSLNSFYHTLEHTPFDHTKWGRVTAGYTPHTIPDSLKGTSIYLSISFSFHFNTPSSKLS